ncbi:rho GDP-dissociation inhibitor 1 isoform X2 [Drosophila obscura]|uniref:rho GDP-dissociation inhibitor 1 isoform X2 n=1 Tax=Drosophila obscura TaxID=7282 RepID=UPI000BA04243|nr:rho GDP-dissociation inhibitor 1 isoform X2 [Drosophila obscura]
MQKAMAETETQHRPDHHDEDVHDVNYQAPPEKTIEEIMAADQEDESLRRYKEALLGAAQTEKIVVEPNDPRKVIVKKLALVVEGRDDMELDLTGDISQLKKQLFVIKEGVQYKVRIDFLVQREIVHGLKYVQKTSRFGMPVDKMKHMVGSYPPKKEIQFYLTPAEEAPSGTLSRGTYSVSSIFTDDDKHIHLEWDWTFEIKKDWA